MLFGDKRPERQCLLIAEMLKIHSPHIIYCGKEKLTITTKQNSPKYQ